MNLSLKSGKKPDSKSRLLLRSGKWKAALPFYEEQARADEQDYSKLNLLGDIQFRAGDSTAAASSWLRVMDGFAQESLHENVLGVGRKIAKRCPEETSVHLVLSDAYLGLEYYADAISSFRSYVKLCKQATSAEKKNWFRRVLTIDIAHPHLLEEVQQIYEECAFEDIELEREVKAWVKRMFEAQEYKPESEEILVAEENNFESPMLAVETDGLMTIDTGWSGQGADFIRQDAISYDSPVPAYAPQDAASSYVAAADTPEEDIPDGQGKDHFDLGVVYAEMKLWDAAITEFQTARRDRSIRSKATIELAQCFKNSNDPHRALRLLEDETAVTAAEADVQDDLNFQMGVLNETLGNAAAAAACYEKVSAESQNYGEATSRAARVRA
ncbi:MAG: hypothetical protein IPH10_02290 [bacterium]|nr:hypothetical protein [bacterium]